GAAQQLCPRFARSGGALPDSGTIEYRVSVVTKAVSYRIDPALAVPARYPLAVARHLGATDTMQVDDPAIADLVGTMQLDRGSLLERVGLIYRLTNSLAVRPMRGPTDAVTALRVGEASASGKSHLFVTLARAAGIPARLVGGVILDEERDGELSGVHHQWVELYAAGNWVPFCPTFGHFAELPGTYLTVYRDADALFTHSEDISFRSSVRVSAEIVPTPSALSSFEPFNVWALFQRLGLPFSLLRTMLVLPIGALIVVFFRNVVGIPTFGTFLPALIAAAASETGLLWGMVGILLVMVVVALVRMLLGKLELLHSPTLAILLWAVVMTMLCTSLLADHLGLAELAKISVFPIAVIAIAAERFYLVSYEHGLGRSLKELLGTFVVVGSCYLLMSSLALQLLLSSFPEVLLCVVAANIYLGCWVGMRVSEYLRFRHLLVARK
ncbi:MAG: 7TM domain-containing protein, partial [Myxococcota bacterium]